MSLAMKETHPLLENIEDDAPPALPLLSPTEEVIHDYQAQGLSLRGHPFASLRNSLNAKRIVTAASLKELKPEGRYRVAGLVLVRQRPQTAKGTTFMTLEDETGTVNLIVWLNVWERYRRIGCLAKAVIATGRLQRQETVTHLVVERLQDLTTELPALGRVSRDFH
jgi:error-prone DNA polymerase